MKWKIVIGSLLAILVLIQFLNSKLPETALPGNKDFFVTEKVPDEIKMIISRSCYDCHSMQTKYPWYSHIAPVKWMVRHDIEWGRGDVNFSEWGSLEDKDKIKKLGEISEVIEKKEMPLPIYLFMHTNAKLSAEDREKLINWADSASESYFE
jgi:hypothetical protein